MSMLGVFGGEVSGGPRCSRAGCREGADWAIQWRNPKIHATDRRKIWLACSEHREVLESFLAARDFPLNVIPAAELAETELNASPKERNA